MLCVLITLTIVTVALPRKKDLRGWCVSVSTCMTALFLFRKGFITERVFPLFFVLVMIALAVVGHAGLVYEMPTENVFAIFSCVPTGMIPKVSGILKNEGTLSWLAVLALDSKLSFLIHFFNIAYPISMYFLYADSSPCEFFVFSFAEHRAQCTG